jgi:cell division GTPase FtsZ
MKSAGSAMMGIGSGTGENRAVEAAEAAVSNPLLEESITGATGVIFSVAGGPDMTLHEVNAAAEVIYNAADPNAHIIFGTVVKEKLEGQIILTVIATGFKNSIRREPLIFTNRNKIEVNDQGQIQLDTTIITNKKEAYPQNNPLSFLDENPMPELSSTEDFDIPAFIRNR